MIIYFHNFSLEEMSGRRRGLVFHLLAVGGHGLVHRHVGHVGHAGHVGDVPLVHEEVGQAGGRARQAGSRCSKEGEGRVGVVQV